MPLKYYLEYLATVGYRPFPGVAVTWRSAGMFGDVQLKKLTCPLYIRSYIERHEHESAGTRFSMSSVAFSLLEVEKLKILFCAAFAQSHCLPFFGSHNAI